MRQDLIAAVAAKHGPPYESDGTCELCNTSGPTWEAEEAITENAIPLCAECLTQAAAHSSNSESDPAD